MANLYVEVDEKSRERLKKKVELLQRRHRTFRDWLKAAEDPITRLVELLFPDGIPMTYAAANLSYRNNPERNITLALRPLEKGGHWPFRSGVSLAVKGYWPTQARMPRLQIQDIYETADVPLQSYERELDVIVCDFDNNPVHRRASENNALTQELARDLPPIAYATGKKLDGWADYLQWKRNLIQERARGIRYTGRSWSENGKGSMIVFVVVAENKETLRNSYSFLSRQDVMVQGLEASMDSWNYKAGSETKINKLPRGVALGALERLGTSEAAGKIQECAWSNPVRSELIVSLSEEDINDLENADGGEERRKLIIDRIPAQGFLTLSLAGDMALVNRHERSINLLKDQGGLAPYLSTYLFDASQAWIPETLIEPDNWYREDLNEFQKNAVKKIISAPELCLVQGPPGTGKTTVIAEAVLQLASKGNRVILASQAHTAVDNAMDRLGAHPGMRVIRLARDVRRVSDDGKSFVESASLARYYESLAAYTGGRLEYWKTQDDRLKSVDQWLANANLVNDNIKEAKASLIYKKKERAERYADLKKSQDGIINAQKEQERAQARRNALQSMLDGLKGDRDILGVDWIMMPSCSPRLADSLFRLEDVNVKLPFSRTRWESRPDDQGEILKGLLGRWFEVKIFLATMKRDAADIERGEHLHPESVNRLEQIEKELQEIDPDTEYGISRLKNLTNEKKSLKRASGIDGGVYQRLFSDADSALTGASPGHEAVVVNWLNDRVVAIQVLQKSIEERISEHVAHVEDAIEKCAAPPVDESEYRSCEERVREAEESLEKAEKRLESRRNRVREMLESPVLEGHASQYDTRAEVEGILIRTIERLEDEKRDLLERQQDANQERNVWEPVLVEWHELLKQPGVALRDWEHCKDAYIASCNVVGVTCNEGERTLENADQTTFDVAIIDEVSKATPPELLLPLMRASRSVLVGDHRQLPPLFQEGMDAESFSDAVDAQEGESEERRTALTRENFRKFEKMVTASLFREHFEKAHDSIKERLEIQFRMHPQIMAMVNHFYEHRLKCGLEYPNYDRNHGITLRDIGGRVIVSPARDDNNELVKKDMSRPVRDIPDVEKQRVVHEGDHVLWVDTTRNLAGKQHREDVDEHDRPLRSNRLEAQLVAHTLCLLDEQEAQVGYTNNNRLQVGVVSFYARQCRLIREEIRKVRPDGKFSCLEVEVNTVIRYQGKEKPVILVSMVRNDGIDRQAMGNTRRRRASSANVARFEFINVAFSRAQELLIVFGARSTCESYNIRLPDMDGGVTTEQPVYKRILDSLDRSARLIPASRFMRVPAQNKNK